MQAVQILLGLIAANLVLERFNALLALKIIDLLLLAQWIRFSLNALQLLIVLQTLQLLIVLQLIQLLLCLIRVRLPGLQRLAWVSFFYGVELALQAIELLVSFEVFELLLPFQFLDFVVLAILILFLQNFVELIVSGKNRRLREKQNAQQGGSNRGALVHRPHEIMKAN